MSDKFTIVPGDLVIMMNASYYTEWDGSIGEVLQPLRYTKSINLNNMQQEYGWFYLVRLENGREVRCGPHQVRKIDGDEHLNQRMDERGKPEVV
jgi:hypothetical protein